MVPAGTVSVAHRLLDPRGHLLSSKANTSAKSRSQSESSVSSESNNPKSVTSSPPSSVKPISDIDVEFVSACVEDDNSDRKRNSGHFDGGDVNSGHRSLIENVYGVEGRENHPRKRVKTAGFSDEDAKSVTRAAFSAPGDSGLGKWMKEGQGKLDTSSPATLDIVDLTNSKDGKFSYFTVL